MIVTRSVRIAPGTYQAPAGDSGAIVVRGSHVTLDLSWRRPSSATTTAPIPTASPAPPSGSTAEADITVRGLVARGYKVGIIARGVRGLKLLDNDLSYNYRPRLYSGITKESLVDWLDYHQNEHDEWLRYGAGIYLDRRPRRRAARQHGTRRDGRR